MAVPKPLLPLLSLTLCLLLAPQAASWCYYTSFSVTQEASKIDYCSDNTRIAITSTTQQQAFIYDPVYYTVLHTISFAGRQVRTARFTKDTLYLAVGLNNGTVMFLTGKPPYSNTPLWTIDIEAGKTITDIGFNSNNMKMVVCFSNSANDDFYVVYDYAGGSPSVDSQQLDDFARGCKLSENDEAVLIDDNKKAWVFDTNAAGSIITPASTELSDNNRFMDVDVRRTTASPTKVIVANQNDDKGGHFFDGDGSYTQNTFTNNPGSPVLAACFSPQNDYYAFGGEDQILYVFDEATDTNQIDFAQPIRNIQSCAFSQDGEYLLAGIIENSGSSLVYIYRQNCNEACPAGFYAKGTYNCTPCALAMPSCSLCLDASVCMACFQGYYVNMTTYSCLTCHSAITGCSTCADSVTCIECNPGYFLNGSNWCEPCSDSHTGCLTCDSTNCQICSLSYYNNAGTCTLCAISNCLRCTAVNVCVDCQMGYYIASAGSVCTPCDSACFTCDLAGTNCTSCVSGYYENNFACTACSSGCSVCSNATYCYSCASGYYESATGVCSNCDPPCAQCSNQTACLSCTLGYYLSSTTCSSCDPGCSSCENTTHCLSCMPGRYLLSNACPSCTDLVPGCTLCNSTSCLECVSTYYANAGACDSCVTAMMGCEVCSNGTVCDICAVGYYHTGATGSGACSRCEANCQTCNETAYCFSCQAAYYLLANNTCAGCLSPCSTCQNSTACLSCVIGYYSDGSGGCLPCSNITNCQTCSNSTFCTSCSVGYYETAAGGCSQCDTNCLHCNSTQCLACNLGFYVQAHNHTCSACPANCSQCDNATYCHSCSIGYFHNSSLTSDQCVTCSVIDSFCLTCDETACFSCASGRYLSGGACVFCGNLTDKCLECTSTNCLSCQDSYHLDSNTCVSCSSIAGCLTCSNSTTCLLCSSGFYLNSTDECAPCPSKCSSCNDSSTCLACAPSFYFDSGASDCLSCLTANLTGCVSCFNTTTCLSCAGGYYLDSGSGQCSICTGTMQGCWLCSNSSNCLSCQQGYFHDAGSCILCASNITGCLLCNETTTCLLCDTGYHLATSGVVTSCSSCSALTGCHQCDNSTWCSACLSGYYLLNGTCSLCQASIQGCIFCDNSTVCAQCKSGYHLEAGATTCSPCANSACEICLPSNSSLCVTCNNGYFMAGNHTCSPCPSNCFSCNSTACALCETGYFIHPSDLNCSLCSDTLPGCRKCSSDTVCLECDSMYYLNSSNQCQLCSSSITGCSLCSNDTTCLDCDGGFYLHASNNCSLCSDLTGCLICNSSSHCLACDTTYFLAGGVCTACSASIPNCFECVNSTQCTSCQTGYAANGSVCNVSLAASGSGGGSTPGPENDLQFATYYVDSSTLKHVLSSQELTFSNFDMTSASTITLSLQLSSGALALTITSVQTEQSSHAAVFFTNNPLNSLAFKRVPSFSSGRLMTGQSVDPNAHSGISVPQSTLATILPELTTTSSYSSADSLDDPEFYSSYIKQNHQMYWYLVGVIYLTVWLIYLIVRSYHYPQLTRHASEIIPHLLTVKTVPLVIYPTYAQYVSYALGFMALDLPWVNELLPEEMADPLDYAPRGFFYYFTNMNFAAMSFITFCIYLLLLGFSYLLCADSKVQEVELKDTQKVSTPNLLFNSFKQLLVNFFYFGFAFAGFCSLVGSLYNSTSVISVNGMFYIMGVLIMGAFVTEAFYRVVTMKEIGRARVVCKAGLLAGAVTNPIYLAAVATTLDIILMVVQYWLRKDKLVCRKAWMACQVLAQLSLISFYFLPDSLLSIILTALFAIIVLPIDIYMTCQQVDDLQNNHVQQNKSNPMLNTHQKLFNASSHNISESSSMADGFKQTKLAFGDSIDFEDVVPKKDQTGGSFSPTRRSRRFRNPQFRNTKALQVRNTQDMPLDLGSIDEEP